MFMERRLSERKQIDVNVYVSQPKRGMVCCRALDISTTGVFLNTNDQFISRRKKLDLVFALSVKSSNVVRIRHLSVLVARISSSGIGVAFCNRKRG